MKLIHYIIIISAIISCQASLYAFELSNVYSEELNPLLDITKDESGVTVSYDFPGAFIVEDDLFSGTYSLSIPGFGVNMIPGSGAWLNHWDTFEIPENCIADVQILDTKTSIFPIKLAPSRPPLIDSSNEVYSIENVPEIEPYSGWMPKECVEKSGIKIYRDRNILYVGIFPVSYNVEECLLKAYDHITYKVNFQYDNCIFVNSANVVERHEIDSNYFGNVFTSTLTNEDSNEDTMVDLLNPLATSSDIDQNDPLLLPSYVYFWNKGPGYLILTCSKYASAVSNFATWKKKMGYNVTIIMANNWTPEKIKKTIREQYSLDSLLTYVLLVGDELDIPGELHKDSDYEFYTDYFYSCMDGDEDDVQDLFCGRVSVSSLEEAKTVIDKIIGYEKFELLPPKNNVVHCAEFTDKDVHDGYEDVRFTRTSEDVANGIISEGKTVTRVYYKYDGGSPVIPPTNWNNLSYGYGEEVPDFLKNSSFNWKGSSKEIREAINSGALYVLHRGHGDIQSWSKPVFNVVEEEYLGNKNKLPVIFSINCLTGMFQYYPIPSKYRSPSGLTADGRSTCLAESFIRNKNGGGVGVVAASQISYSGYNDVLTMEMFQLIWPTSQFCVKFPLYSPSKHNPTITPVKKLGEVLNASKLKLSQNYLNSKTCSHTRHIFHLFGDPSMRIIDETPISPSVKVTINKESLLGSGAEYRVEMSDKYRLVRVPIVSGDVRWLQRSEYVIPAEDLDKYKYYIVADNIAPTPLDDYFSRLQNIEAKMIEDVVNDGNVVSVHYKLPQNCLDATISVRGITTYSVKTVSCPNDENIVPVNMQGMPNGLYVIELCTNGIIVDTRKIMIK